MCRSRARLRVTLDRRDRRVEPAKGKTRSITLSRGGCCTASGHRYTQKVSTDAAPDTLCRLNVAFR
jgi:hypothetical protein